MLPKLLTLIFKQPWSMLLFSVYYLIISFCVELSWTYFSLIVLGFVIIKSMNHPFIENKIFSNSEKNR